MKSKFLILSSLALLTASCADEALYENAAVSTTEKGITFSVVENPETRGEVTATGSSFFYAEQDRVAIYADNVNEYLKSSGSDVPVVGYNKAFVYKATRSQGNPRLTGIDDKNTLAYKSSYADDAKMSFFMVYPSTFAATPSGSNFSIAIGNNHLATQATTGTTANFDSRVMFDYVETSAPAKGYTSVGESLGFELESPLAMLWFKVSDIESYNFGKLNSIKIKSTKGYTVKNDGSDPKSGATYAKDLTFGESGLIVYNKSNNVTTVSKGKTPGKEIILTVGGTIKNDTKLNMFVLPHNGQTDDATRYYTQNDYEVTYTFADVELIYTHESKKRDDLNAWVGGATYNVFLSVAEKFAHVVTLGSGTNDRTLYINKGKVTDIDFTDGSAIMWTDSKNSTAGKVEWEEIKKVVIGTGVEALGSADWEVIGKMTSLEELEVNNNTTEVPASKLNALASLVSINMPNVTTLHKESFAGSNLTTVILPKFDFANSTVITGAVLKPASLTKLDMSGVSNMKQVYPNDGMTLQGFSNLAEVTVKDGVVLGPEAFKDCVELDKVNGYVTLGGYGAFQNCEDLTSIAINEDAGVVNDYTFSGAELLQKVYTKDKVTELMPVEIGEYAFEGTAVNLDLSQTTKIGAHAFDGVTALIGKKDTNKNIYLLTVGASEIGEFAFKGIGGTGTSDIHMHFTSLTEVPSGLLNSMTRLKELKFGQIVTFAETVGAQALGITANATLFVKPGQAYTQNRLYVSDTVNITFRTIVEE